MRCVMRQRRRLLALLVAVMAVLTACDVRLEVGIDVEEDGSGVVSAGVGIDREAQTRFGNLADVLVTDDLVAAGWEVSPPQTLDDGREWVTAQKAFANPDQLQVVLDELFGAGTVFTDVELIREGDGSTREYAVTGTVDLSEGLDLFGDPELDALLEIPPLGIDLAELEAQLGAPVADFVTAEVVVTLPTDEEQRFEVPLGEQLQLDARGVEENRVAQLIGWVRWALLALFLLSLVLAAINVWLDRRFDRQRPERRPARVRERVRGADAAGGAAVAAGASSGPRPQMQMIVLDSHDVLFRWPADPTEFVVPFAQGKGATVPADEIVELHRQATLGRMRSPAFWQACGVTGDPEQLDAELLASVRLQPGAKEFLREMHRRGVPVAVVTNDLADWSHRLRDLHGLGGVAPWIVSSEVGVRKPDPAAFEALRRVTGVPYFSMVVVDAKIPSLDSARTLGAMTAWFTRRPPVEGADPGHAVITKFADFFRRRRTPEPAGRRPARR